MIFISEVINKTIVMVGTGYILVLVILVGYTSSAPLPQKVSTGSLPHGESTTVSVPLPWTIKEAQTEVDDENDNDENDEERGPKIFGGWLSQNLPLAVANNEIVRYCVYTDFKTYFDWLY